MSQSAPGVLALLTQASEHLDKAATATESYDIREEIRCLAKEIRTLRDSIEHISKGGFAL